MMRLHREGARNGCWMACTTLGRAYAYGYDGVTKNIKEAIRLFKRSIELRRDNAYANYELGRVYELGLTGKIDLPLAERYYWEAVKHGSEPAIQRAKDKKLPTS